MDTIFGSENFLNEIIWKRTSAHSSAKRYGPVHDILLFYTKTSDYKWNIAYTAYDLEYEKNFYRYADADGRKYQLIDLSAPGDRTGTRAHYEWKGRFPPKGRHWAQTEDTMKKFESEERIIYSSTGTPRFKQYLDEMSGLKIQDIWIDMKAISSQANERLGYATRKPEALLERIIKASSNEGDIVLDPFCGCGTAVVVAQKLNRKWIGIDITHLAIGLMKWRLKNLTPPAQFTVVGEPKDLTGAEELAKQDKYQFQWWAVAEVGGRPYGEKKKGADTGIDGYLYYMDEKDKIKKVIISVKGGHNVGVNMIYDLSHVIDREKADIGVFISIDEPTRPMTEEAAMKGFYHSPLGRDYPKIQILTIAQILQGKRPDIPPWIAPIPKSMTAKSNDIEHPKLL